MEAILLFLEITPNVHIILFSSNLLDQVFSNKKINMVSLNMSSEFKYFQYFD